MSGDKSRLTRRDVLVAGAAGAATLAGSAAIGGDMKRMPVVYIPHGGGPWTFIDLGFPKGETESLRAYLQDLATALPQPKALLVVSAHWEERVPTVMTSAQPPMLYDYYGFPPEAYRIRWPAPGEPALAARVRKLLEGAGIKSAADDSRGFDHGTFIPLQVTYPDADIPTVQLSLQAGLDPEAHIKMGRALAPLRDEGVLIVGSGMSFHNLRAMRDPRAPSMSKAFDAWLQETVALDEHARDRRLADWSQAPGARFAHPREEHLLPLMVVAGAAGGDRGKVPWTSTFMGSRVSAAMFG